MRERLRISLLLAAAAWLLVPPPGVEAKDGYDTDDVVYATGAIFEFETDLAASPARTCSRRSCHPRPGEQGSCVGGVVGYAACSNYGNLLEGRRLAAEGIPSPA